MLPLKPLACTRQGPGKAADKGGDAKLQIVDDRSKGGKGVHCHGLTEVPVSSSDEILEIIHRAQERRQVGETKMNKASSRCVSSQLSLA